MQTIKFVHWLSRLLIQAYTSMMLKMDVQMHTQLPRGAKIIAINHPTTTDPFYMAAIIRQQSFILINNLLFQVPIFGEYLRRSGHIPVIAGRGQEAIDTALAYLKAGHTIMIFPEGTISPVEGGFAPPRTGVARLALLSGAPVYPAGIHLQSERIHTIPTRVDGKEVDGRWYPKGSYHITIGHPLYFSGDVENHAYVRSVASTVMHHIIELARESEKRMTAIPGTLASKLETP